LSSAALRCAALSQNQAVPPGAAAAWRSQSGIARSARAPIS